MQHLQLALMLHEAISEIEAKTRLAPHAEQNNYWLHFFNNCLVPHDHQYTPVLFGGDWHAIRQSLKGVLYKKCCHFPNTQILYT